MPHRVRDTASDGGNFGARALARCDVLLKSRKSHWKSRFARLPCRLGLAIVQFREMRDSGATHNTTYGMVAAG